MNCGSLGGTVLTGHRICACICGMATASEAQELYHSITIQPWDKSVFVPSQGQVALLGAGWYVSLHSSQVSKGGRCSRQGKPLSSHLIWAVSGYPAIPLPLAGKPLSCRPPKHRLQPQH